MKKSQAVAGLVVGLVAGCGSERPDTSCEPQGVYLIRYSEREGDCGPIEEERAIWGEGALDTAPSCRTTRHEWTNDGCDILAEWYCPQSDGSGLYYSSFISWETSDDRARGELEASWFAADGTLLCTSIYDVQIRRQ